MSGNDENTVEIEVNGMPIKAQRGQMLIEVTDAAEIYVPRFCYHRKLSVAANCRMCLVEVEKAPKPLPARRRRPERSMRSPQSLALCER